MYCNHCGKEIMDEAVICPYCGCETGNGQNTAKSDDAKSAGFAILGFLFPIIGLILYLVWKKDYPLRASSAGKGALVGVIVNVILYILSFIVTLIGLSTAVALPIFLL